MSKGQGSGLKAHGARFKVQGKMIIASPPLAGVSRSDGGGMTANREPPHAPASGGDNHYTLSTIHYSPVSNSRAVHFINDIPVFFGNHFPFDFHGRGHLACVLRELMGHQGETDDFFVVGKLG